MQQLEPTNDAFAYETLNLLSSDISKGLDLYPLCEIINYHKKILALLFAWAKGVDDIHSSLGKWLGSTHMVQHLWLNM